MLATDYQGGNTDTLLARLHQSLEVARRMRYDKGMARAYLFLGEIYAYDLVKPAQALAYYDSASAYIQTANNRDYYAAAALGKANAYITLHRFGAGTNELLALIRRAETPPVDSGSLLSALNNITQVYAEQGDFAAAKRAIFRALALIGADGHDKERLLNSVFQIYYIEGKNDSALFYLQASADCANKHPDPLTILLIEQNFGQLYERTNQPEKARQHLEAALQLLKGFPQREEAISCLASIGRTYLAKNSNQPRKGLEYVRQAETLLDSVSTKNWDIRALVYETAAYLYRDAGDFTPAMHYMELTYGLADSLQQKQQRDKVMLERENYEVTKRDAQIATLATQQAVSRTQRNWGVAIAVLFLGFALFAFFTARRLRTLNQALQAANGTKDKIMSVLSHDLRAPLNTLNTFLQIIRAREMPADQRERAERQLSSQLQATVVMLDNLLRWSLMQVRHKVAVPAVYSAKELIEHAIEPHLGLLELKSLALTTDLPTKLTLYADRDMAVFIVRNLVSNAIKFAPANTTISVAAAAAADGTIEIRVKDSGVGMDADKVETLFSFERNAPTTGTAKERGTGIGLPLAAEMAKENGGELRVNSVPFAGTEMLLRLPSEAA